MNKYILDFDGTIGEFLHFWRRSKKINSVELSKSVGKSDAYVSQIENGRNKNPDYYILYELFKRVGIEEAKIEDYLEYFGFISPERISQEEKAAIERMEEGPSDIEVEHWQQQAEDLNQMYKSYDEGKHQGSNSDSLLYDILEEHIKNINDILSNITEHDLVNGFDLIEGISKSFDEMSVNQNLYKFMIKFFSEKLSSLDEAGMIKVLNSLLEELNRIDQEKTAFGKPHQRTLITKL